MTDSGDNNTDGLDAFFDAARRTPPEPSDALMARVAAQGRSMAPQAERPVPRPASIWRQLFDLIGGAPALAGLAAATVAGVWIGISPPAPVGETMVGLWTGSSAMSVGGTSALDLLTAEFGDGDV